MLNSNQREVYDEIRDWEKLDPTKQGGMFPRIFGLKISRRWGKTTLLKVMKNEDAIRNPRRNYRMASAFQKNIDEIIEDVSQFVYETCPLDLRPRLVGSTYRFRNASQIRLVGLDMHPDGLRGRASDGDVVSEAAFVKNLLYSTKNILYMQYQGRLWARMFTESSSSRVPESEYEDVILADCIDRGAYILRTIDDNPMLSEEEREEFIAAAGGRDHVDCRAEYYCETVRDPEGSVVPEFSVSRHVRLSDVPRYAHCYVGADPGTRDKFGLVFAYWDFDRKKLVVQRSWAERNASLADVAEVIRTTEQELWGVGPLVTSAGGELRTLPDQRMESVSGRPCTHESSHSPEPLQYWDGAKLGTNPHRRVSDTDARVIFELKTAHGIAFNAADKKHAKSVNDVGSARRLPEAKLQSLREWCLNDRIEICPDSGPLPHQLNAGRWNEQRTDFERTDAHGHLDCIMALVYMLPAIERNANPNMPDHIGAGQELFVPEHLKHPEKHTVAQLNKAFGKPRIVSNGRSWVRR